jgi:hypothetical protein
LCVVARLQMSFQNVSIAALPLIRRGLLGGIILAPQSILRLWASARGAP